VEDPVTDTTMTVAVGSRSVRSTSVRSCTPVSRRKGEKESEADGGKEGGNVCGRCLWEYRSGYMQV
jgi:hypothetical protein